MPALWKNRLHELGAPEPATAANLPAMRIASRAALEGGPSPSAVEIDESRDIAKYGRQLRELGDESSVAILHQVLDDEQEHYRILSDLIRRDWMHRPSR